MSKLEICKRHWGVVGAVVICKLHTQSRKQPLPSSSWSLANISRETGNPYFYKISSILNHWQLILAIIKQSIGQHCAEIIDSLLTKSSPWPRVDCSSQNHLNGFALSKTPAFPNGAFSQLAQWWFPVWLLGEKQKLNIKIRYLTWIDTKWLNSVHPARIRDAGN